MTLPYLIGALGALLLMALVLWYLLSRQRPMLLRVVTLRFVPRRPFKPPVRRPPLLAWLALLFVALAATIPSCDAPRKAGSWTVVMVSVGVESAAREVGGRTRLDLAREEALTLLRRARNEDRFALVAASAAPSVVASWATAGEIEAQLRELRATGAGVDWPAAFETAATALGMAENPASLVIIGSRVQEEFRQWATRQNGRAPAARIIRVGTSQPNIGIDSLTAKVMKNAEGQALTQLDMVVRQTGGKDLGLPRMEVTDLAGRILPFGAATAVGVLTTSNQVNHRVVRLTGAGGVDTIRVLVKSEKGGDALAADDEAWFVFRPPARVLLVEPRKDSWPLALERLLAAMPGAQVQVTNRWSPDAGGSLPDLVVQNAAPDAAPPHRVNTLTYSELGRNAEGLFVDYNPASPLCRYLNLNRSPEIRICALTITNGFEPVAYGRWLVQPASANAAPSVFPIITSGEIAGRRQVVFGFDWVDADLTTQNALALLLVNALGWLSPARAMPGAFSTGSPAPAIWSPVARLVRPHHALPTPAAQPATTQGFFLWPGLYEIGGETRIRFAINVRAVDLGVDTDQEWQAQATATSPAASKSEATPRDRWLWLLAAVVLFLEMFWFHYQSTRKPTRPIPMVTGQQLTD